MEKKMKKKQIDVYIRIPKKDNFQIICDEYRNKIAERKDCCLVEIYYDIGMSGFNNERPGYLKMLKAARNKEFDFIVTKHPGKISRRSREMLKIIKELHKIGVAIYFEESDINTL